MAGTLELTKRCCLRCVHCYLGSQELVHAASDREMSTAQVLAILDQVVDAGCLHLLITGGDPLLRRDFPEIYRHARLSGLDVTVFTSGIPITERIVELFLDLPPQIVEITLYGATAMTYERITGVPGSYAHCLAGVGRLHDAGVRLGIKTMLMTLNSHELEAIETIAARYNAKFRFDPVLMSCLDGNRAPLALRVDAGQAIRLEFADGARGKAWTDFRTRNPDFPPSDRLIQCGAGQTGFHVDAYGTLQACVLLPGVSYDLLAGTFAEGWARLAAVRELRARASNRCVSCPKRAYCGYCPGLMALENDDGELPSPYLCALGDERLRAMDLALTR
ncbi:MAG: radical SAM protein [Anaerolineales bacterium]|nr:radical SAM protein [Anaerolineales bacterium]